MVHDLTYVIPVAHYHRDKLERAIAQVEAQSVPCSWASVLDEDRRGPSWGRNQGVTRATTRLVSFLDADDLLEPNHAEETLKKWTPGHYVYTEHFHGDRNHISHIGPTVLLQPPTFRHHVVTTVMSKRVFELVGGFDETLPAVEDTEFYLRLLSRGVCPIYVNKPLMTYTKDGQNSSQVWSDFEKWAPTWNGIINQYKGKSVCKCAEKAPRDPVPVNQEFEGAILVRANWGGKRGWAGQATGRRYPPSGNQSLVWVDVRDQAKNPKRLVLTDDLITPEMDHD